MRVYVCPEHPAKNYTSWRKFRGHWSTQHRGEECPPREEFLQEMEKEEVIREKGEYKEELKVKAAVREEAVEAITAGEFTLPEDPVPRLAKILEVHGVPGDIITQVLGVFQIHPGYRDNPVNLHYLLTAKLNRKMHSSIPMIISAFTAQEGGYPEGMGIGMIPGMQGPGAMPPFMYGGGMQPYYPPTFGYQPTFRQPIGGREEAAGEERRERVRESNPVKDAVALLGTMLDLQDKIGGGKKEGEVNVQEIFEGFRTTLEEVTKTHGEQQDKLMEQMEKVQEGNKAALEGIKEQLHTAEKGRLQDKIETLQETKDEERSEGLGSLLKEAGEGLGTQAEGIRTSITDAGSKIADLAGKIVSTEGLPSSPLKGGASGAGGGRTVSEASELMEAETALEEIAKRLERR